MSIPRTNPTAFSKVATSRRAGNSAFACGALLVLAATLSGCGQPAATHAFETATSEIEELATDQSRRSPDELVRKRGENVFSHYCAICHGETGAGDGFNSFSLKVSPRNFTEPDFWTTTTRERTELVIANGGPAAGGSVLMPGWKRTLSSEQIDDVAAYLRMLPDIHAAAIAAEDIEEEE